MVQRRALPAPPVRVCGSRGRARSSHARTDNIRLHARLFARLFASACFRHAQAAEPRPAHCCTAGSLNSLGKCHHENGWFLLCKNNENKSIWQRCSVIHILNLVNVFPPFCVTVPRCGSYKMYTSDIHLTFFSEYLIFHHKIIEPNGPILIVKYSE